jgi:hypothetical protein
LRLDPDELNASTALPAGSITSNVFAPRGKIYDVEVIDVDHDGISELVASFGTTPRGADTVPDGHVAICPMTSDGRIGGACVDIAADVLGDPALECVDGVRGQARPWCDGTESQLVVLCRHWATGANGLRVDKSYVLPILGADGVYTGSLADSIIEPGRRLDIIQLADVTGDEVGDVVALDASGVNASLLVYPQRNTREEAVCVGE